MLELKGNALKVKLTIHYIEWIILQGSRSPFHLANHVSPLDGKRLKAAVKNPLTKPASGCRLQQAHTASAQCFCHIKKKLETHIV